MGRDSYHHGDLRAALLQVAQDAVERAGTHAFSLRAAADAVGVSPSAVYRHFADKEALLRALAVEVTEAVADRMDAALDAAGPTAGALEQLQTIAASYLDSAAGHPNSFRLVFGPYGLGHPEGVRARDGGPHRPARHFTRLAADACGPEGPLRHHDPAVVASAFWLAVHGAAALTVDGPLRLPRAGDTLRTTIDHLWRGLATPGAQEHT